MRARALLCEDVFQCAFADALRRRMRGSVLCRAMSTDELRRRKRGSVLCRAMSTDELKRKRSSVLCRAMSTDAHAQAEDRRTAG